MHDRDGRMSAGSETDYGYRGRGVRVDIDGLSDFARAVSDDLTYYSGLQGKVTPVLGRPAVGFAGERCSELRYAGERYSRLVSDLLTMLGKLDVGYVSLSSAAAAASVKYGDTDGGNARQLAGLFKPADGQGVIPPQRPPAAPPAGGTPRPPTAHEARMARLHREEMHGRGPSPHESEGDRTADRTDPRYRAHEEDMRGAGRDPGDRPERVGDVTVEPDLVDPYPVRRPGA